MPFQKKLVTPKPMDPVLWASFELWLGVLVGVLIGYLWDICSHHSQSNLDSQKTQASTAANISQSTAIENPAADPTLAMDPGPEPLPKPSRIVTPEPKLNMQNNSLDQSSTTGTGGMSTSTPGPEKSSAQPDIDSLLQERIRAQPKTPVPRVVFEAADQWWESYKSTGSSSDLSFAVSATEWLLKRVNDGTLTVNQRSKSLLLRTHANQRNAICKEHWTIQNVNQAIEACTLAIKATEAEGGATSVLYSNLARHFQERYKASGAGGDLDAAITHRMGALRSAKEDTISYTICLDNLAFQLEDRFTLTGDLADLNAAIDYGTQGVVRGIKEGCPQVARMNSLGRLLGVRFKILHKPTDLDQSIEFGHTALSLIPQNHPDRLALITNLSSRHVQRFEFTNNGADLDVAIELLTASGAVTLTKEWSDRNIRPDSNSREVKGAAFHGLAHALHLRWNRAFQVPKQDLDGAIQAQLLALKYLEEGTTGHAIGQINAATFLISRRGPGDLDAAIGLQARALNVIPETHSQRAVLLTNHASALRSRYELTGDLTALDAAVSNAGAASALQDTLPLGIAFQTNPVETLITLGRCLTSRASREGRDVEEALVDFWNAERVFLKGWKISVAPLEARVRAAWAASCILIANQRIEKALQLLGEVVPLLPLLSPKALRREDQQFNLYNAGDVATMAAGVVLQKGKNPLQAVQFLEMGRYITNNHALDCRGMISGLQEGHIARFNYLSDKLKGATSSDVPEDNPSAWKERLELVNELEAIIAEAHSSSGDRGFLSEEACRAAAAEGPIILINISNLRSDALILTSQEIRHLPLPELSMDQAREFLKPDRLSSRILKGTLRNFGLRNKRLAELLTWLWFAAVKPVLVNLGLQRLQAGADGIPPRVWWIGVGVMTGAPFHAAGDYSTKASVTDPKQPATTLAYCVPMYSPTVRALLFSRRTMESFASGPRKDSLAMIEKALIVSPSATPGAADLEHAKQEVSTIQSHLESTSLIKCTLLDSASPKQVLTALLSHEIVHFSCHGISTVNPEDSHLRLLGEDGVGMAPLRVTEIATQDIPCARLAYLSACLTAATSNEDLVDEVNHIASAFQLAGYAQVVGTMWEAKDDVCAEMAVGFYEGIREIILNGAGRTDIDDEELGAKLQHLSSLREVAAVYRQSLMATRAKYLGQPLKWAPFMLLGA